MFTKSSAAWCGPDLDSIGNMSNLVCLWEDDLRPGIQFARHIWRLYHRTYETPGIRDFPAWLISRRHSVGSLRTGDHPHPIVVKFVSYRAREGIWGQKKTVHEEYLFEKTWRKQRPNWPFSQRNETCWWTGGNMDAWWEGFHQVTWLGMFICSKIIRKPVGVPKPRGLSIGQETRAIKL